MADVSGLVSYIKDVYWANWKTDRKDIETKWQNNINAFNSISTGQWKAEEGEGWRSNTFVPVTKMKVLAAWSIIVDLLLMNNKVPFDLKPSPWDDITMDDMPEEYQEAINDAIHDMKGLIEQQFVDCRFDRELMKIVMADAIYGETYAKFYVFEKKHVGFKPYSLAPQGLQDPEGKYTRFERTEEGRQTPGVEYWSPWDIFRDLDSDDLQEGAGIIARQDWSLFKTRQQIGKMYYIDANILEAIKAAPKAGTGSQYSSKEQEASKSPGKREVKNRLKPIEVLEFWGRVPRAVVDAFERDLKEYEKDPEQPVPATHEQYEEDGDEVEIMCLIAGDYVIRFARNEEGHRPFYRAVWEEKLDYTYATGVADNLEGIQLIINGMTRAYEDNKKLAANVMGIGNKEKTPDWDGEFKPGLFIDVDDSVDDVARAWQQIVIQDVGESLLNGIAMVERWADDASMMPKILQGAVLDKRKPDTFGEMSMLQANAGKYIGGVIKNLDEGLIELVCQDFYEYNMDDPNVSKGKGNFMAQALGYSSYQDRIIRVNKILQALQLVSATQQFMDECKLDKMLFETFKALDLDTANFIKTKAEKDADMQALMSSPEMQAKMEMMVHTIQAAMLKNAKTEADIEKTRVDTQVARDKADLEAVKTGADIAVKGKQAQAQPQAGNA